MKNDEELTLEGADDWIYGRRATRKKKPLEKSTRSLMCRAAVGIDWEKDLTTMPVEKWLNFIGPLLPIEDKSRRQIEFVRESLGEIETELRTKRLWPSGDKDWRSTSVNSFIFALVKYWAQYK